MTKGQQVSHVQVYTSVSQTSRQLVTDSRVDSSSSSCDDFDRITPDSLQTVKVNSSKGAHCISGDLLPPEPVTAPEFHNLFCPDDFIIREHTTLLRKLPAQFCQRSQLARGHN